MIKIALEGSDGVGKTTLASALKHRLKSMHGLRIVVVSEFGDGPVGRSLDAVARETGRAEVAERGVKASTSALICITTERCR